MLVIKFLPAWSPLSTPPPVPREDVVQVPTNGVGGAVWLDPREVPIRGVSVPSGGMVAAPGKPKLMMDPTDRATWQRPYRFT